MRKHDCSFFKSIAIPIIKQNEVRYLHPPPVGRDDFLLSYTYMKLL